MKLRRVVFHGTCEWKAAAWLAVHFQRDDLIPVYIKGNAGRMLFWSPDGVGKWQESNVTLCMYNPRTIQYTLYVAYAVFWSQEMLTAATLSTEPYGCPLFELLTMMQATFPVANLLCQAKGSWFYSLRIKEDSTPGIRKIHVMNKKDGVTRIFTHLMAMRLS
jgi:hypothetical protein